MPAEKELEVYRAHREAQGRYTYFLLTAAGAGIALAVNQTNGAALAWSQIPLALAGLSWSTSFFCGCRHLVYSGSILYSNLELLRVQRGEDPRTGRNPALVSAAAEGIQLGIGDNSKTGNSYANWQFRLLVAGGILYVTWHVFEMYLAAAALPTSV